LIRKDVVGSEDLTINDVVDDITINDSCDDIAICDAGVEHCAGLRHVV